MAEDIQLKLLDIMRVDSVLQTLMGGTATDPRVYMYYQGNATIDVDHPGYITFSNIATAEAVQAVENPVFSILVWTRTWAVAEQVVARLRALFHKQILVTISSRKLYTKIISEADSYQDQPKFAGKTLHVRAGWSTV